MSDYREGDPVKAVKVVHRSSGSAWPDTKGKVVAVKGDGLTIRWESGWHAESVKDHEIEKA